MGITCEYPPPVAPPLIPNTGPKDGSRKTAILFLPNLFANNSVLLLKEPIQLKK